MNMQLAFPNAFRPFMTASIVLHNLKPGTTDTLILKASIVAGNPYDATSGMAAACSQFSVSVIAADLKSASSIVIGSRIEADPFGEWPELTIQKTYPQGGLIVFDCSANERGQR